MFCKQLEISFKGKITYISDIKYTSGHATIL